MYKQVEEMMMIYIGASTAHVLFIASGESTIYIAWLIYRVLTSTFEEEGRFSQRRVLVQRGGINIETSKKSKKHE